MNLKDSVGLIISLLALTVSLTATYYNIFRVNIHAMLILQDEYPSFTFRGGGLTNASYEPSLTFINDGNRPIVVLGLTWWLHSVYHVDPNRQDCDFKPEETFAGTGAYPSQGSFSPLVVDPNKIGVITVKFESSRSESGPTLVAAGENPAFLLTAHEKSGNLNVVSCLEVRFTTPAGSVSRVIRPISFAEGETRGENEGGAQQGGGPFFNGVPIDLMSDATVRGSSHSS